MDLSETWRRRRSQRSSDTSRLVPSLLTSIPPSDAALTTSNQNAPLSSSHRLVPFGSTPSTLTPTKHGPVEPELLRVILYKTAKREEVGDRDMGVVEVFRKVGVEGRGRSEGSKEGLLEGGGEGEEDGGEEGVGDYGSEVEGKIWMGRKGGEGGVSELAGRRRKGGGKEETLLAA